MAISRRHILVGALAAPAVVAASRLGSAAPAQILKISHQFPGGTIDEGDFRDRICLKFAAELEKRTNGALGGQVYPNSSLMKTVPQFDAVRKGALDLSFYPISYAGGQFPELNIGLMPCLVSSYAQGAAWKASPVGQKFGEFVASKGVLILCWIWQAGGKHQGENRIATDLEHFRSRHGVGSRALRPRPSFFRRRRSSSMIGDMTEALCGFSVSSANRLALCAPNRLLRSASARSAGKPGSCYRGPRRAW